MQVGDFMKLQRNCWAYQGPNESFKLCHLRKDEPVFVFEVRDHGALVFTAKGVVWIAEANLIPT